MASYSITIRKETHCENSTAGTRRILVAIANLYDGLVGDIKRLQGSSDFRLRVGKWRIILSADVSNRIIEVELIDVRGDIYKN